ncbi:MAG: hypothetical protein NWE89_16080 [Candidatus Bathyarchaeota archaeon]|nr:hypothetical protein [Candidatus Bathyarchaeota archaeon]
MSQFDKVEVMDFLINVLKDHERSLDTLISRAEEVVSERQYDDADKQENSVPLKVVLKDWDEFKRRINKVELVCFDHVDSVLIISATTGKKVYEYREKTPEINEELVEFSEKHGENNTENYRLSIGLELVLRKTDSTPESEEPSFMYDIDPQYTRNWLSKELGVHQDFIVCGDIEL